MTREEIIQSLRTHKPTTFVDIHLFDRIPEIFSGDRLLYMNWKRAFAEKLDVDPACITVVGSAALGASLNPDKNFKPFDDKSDLDIAVISSHHFMLGWRYLRMNGARRLYLPKQTVTAWDEHVNKYIYWGTIATDRLIGVLPFSKPWMKATSLMSQLAPANGRAIKLRIYTDYECLRAYQVQAVRSLRDAQEQSNATLPK